ncbi:hypothetical protein [uncultured Brachyspira sp.]|uniref:hypothetical protein n=1 Tax=uncultured Brachyspira sp. TaxID=221953 RepID=UPI0025DD6953|nr:hypothetical protein [uncultured Brachyspira sp.]
MKKFLFIFVLILMTSALAYSFPYNMYTGMTGALRLGGTIYINNDRIGVKNKYTFSTPIMLNFGILRNFDIFARVLPITYTPKLGVGVEGQPQFSIMPRFQFFNGFIGGVEVLFPGSSKQKFGLNPQLHYLIGLGDFFTIFLNLELPMYFNDPRGVVESIRLKTAFGVYPGALFGFSLAGIYLEYHFAYDFYNSAVLYLNRLGLGIYLVLNSDASLSFNLTPYLEQLASGFYFGIGVSLSYTFDFSRFVR